MGWQLSLLKHFQKKALLILRMSLWFFIYFHKEKIHAWKDGIGKNLLISSISKVEKNTL